MKLVKIFFGVLLFSIALVNTNATAAGNTEAKPIIEAMLNNIHTHGFNPCVQGLYINWDASGVNYNATSYPDANPCQRHDRLADLRYLANLWRYKTLFKSTMYDADINLYTPIVFNEFKIMDPRGVVYNEFKDLANLTGNAAYTAQISSILANYANAPNYPDRIDWVIEQGSALIQSGIPEYQAIGTRKIDKALSLYFSDKYNLVLWGTSGATWEVKTYDQLDIAIALARAGYISQAQKIVAGLKAFWDQQYGGYYEGASISFRVMQMQTGKPGKCMAAVVELARLLGDEELLKGSLAELYTKAYIPDLSGVVYKQQQDWSLYTINGKTEDWVTSEAMGISLEALLQ